MTTLENRTREGADAMAHQGAAFSEAMRAFLAYLGVPVVLATQGKLFTITNPDGRKCSVSSRGESTTGDQAAHDIMVLLEQGFRKASGRLAAQGLPMPKIILTGAKLRLANVDGVWGVYQMPCWKDLTFQITDGVNTLSSQLLIDLIESAMKNKFLKKERIKAAA